MAERRLQVVAVVDDLVCLRATGACSDCLGCNGRCALLPGAATDLVQLPRASFPRATTPGEAWTIVLADDALRREAWRVYGSALAGLLLGALAGATLARAIGAADALVALGGLAGTLLASRYTKRAQGAAVRLHDAADAAPADAAGPIR